MRLTPTAAASVLALGIAAAALTALAVRAQSPSPPGRAVSSNRDYPVQPVPFTAVHLNDVFWAPRIETNRTESIPFAFQQCELSGRVDNFTRAAKALRGEPLENTKPPGYPFDDTDLYKVIEGASYTLSVKPDPKLEAYVDSLIEKIAAAQETDGYLYTTRTINPQSPHPWAGKERWELERDDSHELYNLGHLYEAAVAHYQATGKRTLLDIAIRTAICSSDLRPRQEIDLARASDHRNGPGQALSGDRRGAYLKLAKFMLDERGPNRARRQTLVGLDYNQAQQRVIDQTEPSAMPCGRLTCTRGWPTSRR